MVKEDLLKRLVGRRPGAKQRNQAIVPRIQGGEEESSWEGKPGGGWAVSKAVAGQKGGGESNCTPKILPAGSFTRSGSERIYRNGRKIYGVTSIRQSESRTGQEMQRILVSGLFGTIRGHKDMNRSSELNGKGVPGL